MVDDKCDNSILNMREARRKGMSVVMVWVCVNYGRAYALWKEMTLSW